MGRIYLLLFAVYLQGAFADTGLPWYSDFETSDFSEWNNSHHSTLPSIVNAGCHSGAYCSRTELHSGSLNDYYVNNHFGDYFSSNKDKVEEVYLSFFVKFNQGYTFTSGPSNDTKLAIINLTDGISSQRRYQVYIYINAAGEYVVDHSYIGSWQFFGLAQNQGAVEKAVPGQWGKLKLYVKLNTPGQNDGIVQLWVNNLLTLDHSNVNIRENTSYGMGRLILSSYTTRQNSGNGYLYHDKWVLSDTDPDDSLAPNPPSNFR